MEQNWRVEHGLAAGGFAVELRRYQWPAPNELVHEEAAPILGLSLGRPPIGESRPRDAGGRTPFRKLGRLVFTPAGIPFDVRGSGGESLVAACSIALPRFADLTQHLDWTERRLAACGDVRGTSIEALLTRLIREAAQPGFASDVMLEAGGAMMVVELARFFHTADAEPTREARQLSARQLALIEDLVEDVGTVGLAAIAAQCGMSVRSLTRNFRATTGRTVSEAIAEARIRRAKILLEDADLPLKLVAHRTGFASASSFASAFRRATGQSPGAYRHWRIHRA